MMIAEAAEADLVAKRAIDDQERAQERTQLVADARALWDQTMMTHDGKVPVKGADLSAEHTDIENGLVILSDGETAVAVSIREGKIRLAREDDGWVLMSARPITSLWQLGEVLEEVDR